MKLQMLPNRKENDTAMYVRFRCLPTYSEFQHKRESKE